MQNSGSDGDEDVGYLKAAIMSGIAMAMGVWIPKIATGIVYNNLAIFGEFGRSSNFLFCKYFLSVP